MNTDKIIDEIFESSEIAEQVKKDFAEYEARFMKEDFAARKGGAKAPDMTCFIDQFPLAMAAIAAVHDYERGPLVKGDYRPSLLRHLFKIGEHPDHDAAVAWNAIADLETSLRKERDNAQS